MHELTVTEYGDADVLDVTEQDRPTPGEGEVLIDVKAAGVNFADIMQRRGDYLGGPKPPYTPGMEVAGIISEVGNGVDREVGDAVASLSSEGGYADYTVVDAQGLLEIPGEVSFEEAAGFPVQWLTAHNCLHEWGELAEDETVLIHAAAGGVGSAAVYQHTGTEPPQREGGLAADPTGRAGDQRSLSRTVNVGDASLFGGLCHSAPSTSRRSWAGGTAPRAAWPSATNVGTPVMPAC